MKILIAVSGGVDSVVLLDLLARKKLKNFANYSLEPRTYTLSIAHFNHGIHKQAKTHEKFVEALAKQYSLDFFSECSKKKLKSEAEAREARYTFLEKVAKREKCDLIALAHHAGDQSETIFLNLIRGSGMQGLGGMQEFSGKKWRPLLQIPKEKIEKYARKNKLKFVTDPTNLETIYSRNFLRKEILPKLQKLNPKVEDSILRTSRIARENLELIALLAKEWLLRFMQQKSIELAAFNSLPNALKREVVRMIYFEEVGDLRGVEEKHIEEILKLAQNTSGNKQKQFGKLNFKTGKRGGLRVLAW
jgi:tRNA(Ile)-lysidine synthase